MAGAPRPRSLALAFGAYFALLFIAAWYFAQGLAVPWYGPDLSRWVYGFFLLGAAVLLAGMLLIGAVRVQFIERRIVEVNERIGPRGHAAPAQEKDLPALYRGSVEVKDHVDQEIEEILRSLTETEAMASEAATTVDVLAPAETAPPARVEEDELAKLTAKRDRLRRMRATVSLYIAGPAAVAALFVGLSGILLPATEGMLQSLHQLNTTMILAMSYGWIGLAAYAILSVVALLRR